VTTSLIRLVDKWITAPLVGVAGWLRGRREGGAAALPQRIVAIKLVGMGDAVLMLPALGALRELPGAELTVVTTRRAAQIFAASGVAHRVIAVERRGAPRSLLAAARALRAADAVLDFEQHVYWSAALTLLAGRRARRLGLRSAGRLRALAYDQLVEPGRAPRAMKAIFDELARAAGATPRSGLLPLPVSAAARGEAEAWLATRSLSAGGYQVLAPGSGASVRFRRMPAATWADIADGLPADVAVVLVGTPLERELAEEIARRTQRPLHVELGLRLEPLAWLFASAAGVIATDSGPMHLAAAMGAAVTGIFGPDTPARYAPIGGRARHLWLGLSCSPCNNCWVYREARCTNPERYACVRRIRAEQVLDLHAGRGCATGQRANDGSEDHGAENGDQDGVNQAAAGGGA
jgi:heptosyltransferase-1